MSEQHPLVRVRSAEYAALATAPAAARREVAQTLKDWGDLDLIDTAELLVSELVTNSIEAAGSTAPIQRYTDLCNVGRLMLQLRMDAHELLILVWDRDPNPPHPRAHDIEAEAGRGLQLVEAMTARWGWYPADAGGKVVWAAVSRQPAGSSLGRSA